MGCDIHSHVEVKRNDKWEYVVAQFTDPFEEGATQPEPFAYRHYGVFSFLGCTDRNYGRITPLATPRGLPDDLSVSVRARYEDDNEQWYLHSTSWLTVQELLSIDYNQIIEDRRCTKQLGPKYFTGAATCEVGEGTKMPLREYLGQSFMADLEILKALGPPELVRVVFWFDN